MTVQGISRDGATLVGWATLPVPLAVIAVALRFKSRRLIKQTGADDWCMLFALVLYLGLYTSLVVWAPVGKVGFPQSDLSYSQGEKFLKAFWCVQFFYAWVGPAIKMSFLLLYRRMFVVGWFLWATNAVTALVMTWFVGVTFSIIFECWPVGSYWQPLLQEHCIDSQTFCWANGISNLLLDVIIFCLPMPMIWGLHMTVKKKISVSAVFALGAFVCVASILRITYLWHIGSDNVSGTVAIPSIWTSLEPGLGIVCGCLPTLPILFRRVIERHSSSRSSGQKRSFGVGRAPVRKWPQRDSFTDKTRVASHSEHRFDSENLTKSESKTEYVECVQPASRNTINVRVDSVVTFEHV